MDQQQALAHQLDVAATWRKLHWLWYVFFYSLSVAAILLSTLVAAQPEGLAVSETGYGVLAWILAVVTSLLTLFRPNDRAVRYRQAWMGLSIALDRFQAVAGTEFTTVLEARETGERQVHQLAG